MTQKILLEFQKNSEAEAFKKDAEDILATKKYDCDYDSYFHTVPGRWYFKSFLYVMAGAIIVMVVGVFGIWLFGEPKPETPEAPAVIPMIEQYKVCQEVVCPMADGTLVNGVVIAVTKDFPVIELGSGTITNQACSVVLSETTNKDCNK